MIYQFDTELTEISRVKDIVLISDLHSYFITCVYYSELLVGSSFSISMVEIMTYKTKTQKFSTLKRGQFFGCPGDRRVSVTQPPMDKMT